MPPADLRPAYRLPLLLLGFAGLVTATAAGLARFGLPVGDKLASLAAWHSPLMIGGFFGTVIALERAVALRAWWAYAAPLAAGLGTVAVVAGAPGFGFALVVVAATLLTVATGVIVTRQPVLFTAVLAVAAASWCGGSLRLAAGAPPYAVWPATLAFLVLTIAGERLELSRLLPPSPAARRVFVAIAVVLALSAQWPADTPATRVFGASLAALALWLARQDIARRTIRGRGLPRYIAACLLAGYAWLLVAGTLFALVPATPGTPLHDAALHALGLGFVFSMVFGHAPIILPAVLRITLPYRPVFYLPLAALHAAVALRVGGDLAGSEAVARAGALADAAALALFIVTMAATVFAARGSGRMRAAPPG